MNVIVDIDGTISNHCHRLHFLQQNPPDWDSFFTKSSDDLPIWPVVDLINALRPNAFVVLATARSERHRNITLEWLMRYRVTHDMLLMRANNDSRPAPEVKKDFLYYLAKEGFPPDLALEDNPAVADMLEKEGVFVLRAPYFP